MPLAFVNPQPDDYPERLAKARAFNDERLQQAREENRSTDVGCPEAVPIEDETEEYLKSIGQYGPFDTGTSKTNLQNALHRRYCIATKHSYPGMGVFNQLVGEYPLEVDARVPEEYSRMPTTVSERLDNYVKHVNQGLIERMEKLQNQGVVSKDKPLQHIYRKDGDSDYLYIADYDNPQTEKVYKKIGKFLSKHNEIDALKQYREWKNTKKMSQKEDIKLVISTNPADIMRKSTGQWWESRSCERLGGGYDAGIWDDIAKNNAIAYVTVNGNPSWIGRLMLRWCEDDDLKNTKIGVEPVFYGDKSFEEPAREKIEELAEENGLLDYDYCETPYVYKGWSDQMHSTGKNIVYGEKGAEKKIEEEIDSIVADWAGEPGYIKRSVYDEDEIEYMYYYTDDLGNYIRDDLENFVNSYDEIDEIPYDWEESILNGIPEKFDILPSNIRKEFWLKMDFEPSRYISDDAEFVLWYKYVNDFLLKDMIRILRRHGLDWVYYDHPEDAAYPDLGSGWRVTSETMRSGIYDMTMGVTDVCLKDENCRVINELQYTRHVERKEDKNFEKGYYETESFDYDGAPFFYGEAKFLEEYGQNIASFVKCVYDASDNYADPKQADIDLKEAKFDDKNVLEPDFDKLNASKKDVLECFEEYLEPIGSGYREERYRKQRGKTDFVGGIIPLDRDISTLDFVKKARNIDFDVVCRDIKEKSNIPKQIVDLCKIDRPLEKFGR